MAEKANILLVDDRDDNLTTLEAILTSLDQNLIRANSGEAALKALLERDFAVILLDVMMPGMDGFETAAHIKQREKTKDVPIIFLTGANVDRHQVFRGYASQAIDYLTKPFDPWVLRSKVEVFVELYHTKRKLREQSRTLRRQLGEDGGDPGENSLVELLAKHSTAITADLKSLREKLTSAGDGLDEETAGTLRDLDRSTAELNALIDTLRESR